MPAAPPWSASGFRSSSHGARGGGGGGGGRGGGGRSGGGGRTGGGHGGGHVSSRGGSLGQRALVSTQPNALVTSFGRPYGPASRSADKFAQSQGNVLLGRDTADAVLLEPRSIFAPNQPRSQDERPRAPAFASGPYMRGATPRAKHAKHNRFVNDSLDKDVAKRLTHQETLECPLLPPSSTFRTDKFASKEHNQPAALISGRAYRPPPHLQPKQGGAKTAAAAGATAGHKAAGGGGSGSGAAPPLYDRFAVHSIPKETMKKVFGLETAHLGLGEQPSSFKPNKMVSTQRNQPCSQFAARGYKDGVGATGQGRYNKFKVDSIPKETMKKVFGLETMALGLGEQPSSFEPNKMVSTQPNQPCLSFATRPYVARGANGDGGGASVGGGRGLPLGTYDKFKVHSIPKETMKKVFGLETMGVDFHVQGDGGTLRTDTGVPFGGGRSRAGPDALVSENPIADAIHW